MSYTEIYAVSPNSCQKIGDCRNAHRGAMYVWRDIAVRYFKLEHFPHFDEAMQRRIWNASNEHEMPEHEIIVLASTMDDVTVKFSDKDKLIAAFERYQQDHPNSSIGEQTEIIKAVIVNDGDKIAWCQMSVCEFGFSPDYDEETDTYTYNDLSKSWDLFEQVESILCKE